MQTVCNNVPGTTILLSLNEQAISVTMQNNIVDKLKFLILVFDDIMPVLNVVIVTLSTYAHVNSVLLVIVL